MLKSLSLSLISKFKLKLPRSMTSTVLITSVMSELAIGEVAAADAVSVHSGSSSSIKRFFVKSCFKLVFPGYALPILPTPLFFCL